MDVPIKVKKIQSLWAQPVQTAIITEPVQIGLDKPSGLLYNMTPSAVVEPKRTEYELFDDLEKMLQVDEFAPIDKPRQKRRIVKSAAGPIQLNKTTGIWDQIAPYKSYIIGGIIVIALAIAK